MAGSQKSTEEPLIKGGMFCSKIGTFWKPFLPNMAHFDMPILELAETALPFIG